MTCFCWVFFAFVKPVFVCNYFGQCVLMISRFKDCEERRYIAIIIYIVKYMKRKGEIALFLVFTLRSLRNCGILRSSTIFFLSDTENSMRTLF